MIMEKLVLILLALMALSGCNTVHGFGKDVEATGEAIQKSTR